MTLGDRTDWSMGIIVVLLIALLARWNRTEAEPHVAFPATREMARKIGSDAAPRWPSGFT